VSVHPIRTALCRPRCVGPCALRNRGPAPWSPRWAAPARSSPTRTAPHGGPVTAPTGVDTTGAGDAIRRGARRRWRRGLAAGAARWARSPVRSRSAAAGAQESYADLETLAQPWGALMNAHRHHPQRAGQVDRRTAAHGTFVISDAGLPLPWQPCVDLGYRYGQPGFLDVTRTVFSRDRGGAQLGVRPVRELTGVPVLQPSCASCCTATGAEFTLAHRVGHQLRSTTISVTRFGHI